MNHGLTAATVTKIHEVFGRHSEIEKAVLYGSRAKGNFKPSSDIDLTLIGVKLDSKILDRLDGELDDVLLPYEFDLSIFSKLTHPELIEHIRRAGVIFYERPPA